MLNNIKDRSSKLNENYLEVIGVLENVNLKGANLENTIISLDQLLQAKTLYQTKGIPQAILDEIKKQKPELLEKPKKKLHH